MVQHAAGETCRKEFWHKHDSLVVSYLYKLNNNHFFNDTKEKNTRAYFTRMDCPSQIKVVVYKLTVYRIEREKKNTSYAYLTDLKVCSSEVR